MTPKFIKKNIKIDRNIQNKSCSTTWVDPKTVVEPYSSPLGPQKDKNVRIQGIIENDSCPSELVDPKTVFESHIELKNSPLGPKKVKTTPIISQNQIPELKETKKIKVVALDE